MQLKLCLFFPLKLRQNINWKYNVVQWRIQGIWKGVHLYKGVEVRFVDFV